MPLTALDHATAAARCSAIQTCGANWEPNTCIAYRLLFSPHELYNALEKPASPLTGFRSDGLYIALSTFLGSYVLDRELVFRQNTTIVTDERPQAARLVFSPHRNCSVADPCRLMRVMPGVVLTLCGVELVGYEAATDAFLASGMDRSDPLVLSAFASGFPSDALHASGFSNGALYIAGSVHIVDSTIRDFAWSVGMAFDSRGGALFVDNGGTITLTRCNLTANLAYDGFGGALFVEASGEASLQGCILQRNSAGAGGAVYSAGGVLTMRDCALLDNLARIGSAIYMRAPWARQRARPPAPTLASDDPNGTMWPQGDGEVAPPLRLERCRFLSHCENAGVHGQGCMGRPAWAGLMGMDSWVNLHEIRAEPISTLLPSSTVGNSTASPRASKGPPAPRDRALRGACRLTLKADQASMSIRDVAYCAAGFRRAWLDTVSALIHGASSQRYDKSITPSIEVYPYALSELMESSNETELTLSAIADLFVANCSHAQEDASLCQRSHPRAWSLVGGQQPFNVNLPAIASISASTFGLFDAIGTAFPLEWTCPLGWYMRRRASYRGGFTGCDHACPVGTFGDSTHLEEAYGPNGCKNCEAGYYCGPEPGAIRPTPCPAGTHLPNASGTSNASCVACVEGTYGGSEGNANETCTMCARGLVSTAARTACALPEPTTHAADVSPLAAVLVLLSAAIGTMLLCVCVRRLARRRAASRLTSTFTWQAGVPSMTTELCDGSLAEGLPADGLSAGGRSVAASSPRPVSCGTCASMPTVAGAQTSAASSAVASVQPLASTHTRELLCIACSPSQTPLRGASAEILDVATACQWGAQMDLRFGGRAEDLFDDLCRRPTVRLLFAGHTDTPTSTGRSLGFTHPGAPTHTQTRTHAHAHAHTHAHARPHTRTRTPTPTPTHPRTYTRACTHACTHAHMHILVASWWRHAHTHKHAHAHAHAHICTCAHTCTCAWSHTLAGGELVTFEADALVELLAQLVPSPTAYLGPHARVPPSHRVLRLVFLNGCKTELLGWKLRGCGVECVVCWRTRVRDDAARLFSTRFFQVLARGVAAAAASSQPGAHLAQPGAHPAQPGAHLAQPGAHPSLAYIAAFDAAVYATRKARSRSMYTRKYLLTDPEAAQVSERAPLAAGIPVLLCAGAAGAGVLSDGDLRLPTVHASKPHRSRMMELLNGDPVHSRGLARDRLRALSEYGARLVDGRGSSTSS